MKNKTKRVLVIELEREITDLRAGLNKTAAKLAECMVELEDERETSKKLSVEVANLKNELVKQAHYQTRAHETIELLVKKMPYQEEDRVKFVVENRKVENNARLFRAPLSALMRDRDRRLNEENT